MLVEIHGARLDNKGAELMLLTVMERLSHAIPGVRFCSRPMAPFHRMLALGITPILSFGPQIPADRPLAYRLCRFIQRRIPRKYCERHNVVRSFDVDAFVDVSGYAFGDKWPVRQIETLRERAGEYRRRGRPVILLPQMFGPFEKPGYEKAIRKAMEHVDVAFARESTSRDHLIRAIGDSDKVKVAPDITIFRDPGQEDVDDLRPRQYCCVVPNVRMVTQGASEWGENYMSLLERVSRRIIDAGLEVLVLVHDTTETDKAMARELVQRVGAPQMCRVFQDEDPLRLKTAIWHARFLVGSRFHSLVAALSGGVPVIAMGWAHKYEELARDFGVSDYVVTPADAVSSTDAMLDQLMDPHREMELRARLKRKKESLREKHSAMWAETIARLGSSSGTSVQNARRHNDRRPPEETAPDRRVEVS